MKKLLKLLSIVALIMAVTLTACKKNETPEPTPDPDPVTPTPDPDPDPDPEPDTTLITNVFALDTNVYEIKSTISYVENGDIEMIFTMEGFIAEFSFEGNFTEIPTGTFNLTDNGNYEGEFMNTMGQYDYDLIGSIVITKEGNIYTVVATGNAVDDSVTKTFTMTYQGEIINANEPQGEGTLTVDGKTVNIVTGLYSSVESQGFKVLTIVLADMLDTKDDSHMIGYTFMNQETIPTGTFALSSMPLTGAMAVIEFDHEEYVSSLGTLTISKEGDVYTITSQGTATEYGKETFSSTYTGNLIEMSLKK